MGSARWGIVGTVGSLVGCLGGGVVGIVGVVLDGLGLDGEWGVGVCVVVGWGVVRAVVEWDG